MYGLGLDRFAIAGREGRPIPSTNPTDEEQAAYNIGERERQEDNECDHVYDRNDDCIRCIYCEKLMV